MRKYYEYIPTHIRVHYMNFKRIFMMSQNVKKTTTINTRHERLIGRKDESKHIINTIFF